MLAESYYNDMINLCRLDVKSVHWYYKAHLITEKGDMEVDSLISMDITKDFELGFTDNCVVEIKVLKRFYIESVFPVRDKLKLRLDAEQVSEKQNGIRLTNPKRLSKTYRAILVDPVDYGNDTKSASTPHDNTDVNADKDLISIKVQLVELAIEQLMRMTFGGNFHGKPGEIGKAMLTESFSHLDVSEGAKMSGVDMYTIDNNEQSFDMVVPHGTKLIDIPRFIQDKRFGIYNYGIGSYIMEDIWYIYPLYKYDRYKDDQTKLTISVIPKGKMMDNMRTYHVYNREVNILCGGEVSSKDNSQVSKTNSGDGVTYYDSNKIKHEAVQKEGDKVFINPEGSKKQIMGQSRGDNLDTAPIQEDKLNTSLAKAMTSVAQKSGQIMSFVWEYANPHLLVPGMATKVVYYKDNVRYEVTGTLLKQVSLTQLQSSMVLKRHTTSVALVVVVDNNMLRQAEDKQYGEASKGTKSGMFSSISSWF